MPLISEYEAQLLLGNLTNFPDQPLLAQSLGEGKYDQALTGSEAKLLFGDEATGPPAEPRELPDYIRSCVERYLQASGPEKTWRDITLIAVACLCAFVQTSWTGPPLDLDPAVLVSQPKWREPAVDSAAKGEERRAQLLRSKPSPELADLHKFICNQLSVDGEEVYPLIPRLLYLYLARCLLVDLPTSSAEWLADRDAIVPSATWWAARLLRIQQEILDSPTSTLFNQLIGQFKAAQDLYLADPVISALDEKTRRQLRARLFLERGLAYHLYGMNRDAYEDFVRAQQASGLRWRLSGAKGKRTKFQTFDVAQLVLIAENDNENGGDAEAVKELEQEEVETMGIEEKPDALEDGTDAMSNTHHRVKVKGRPDTVMLNDDTLLENIEFTQDADRSSGDGESPVDPAKQQVLRAFDQCLLLAFCLHVKNENPAHGLTTEEMMPYVTRVLTNPNNWMVHTMALLLRSRLESDKSRTVERSALQMQTLVDQTMDYRDDDAGASERLAYFFVLCVPSRWEMERELANRFMSLGVLRSALEIFERLQMWEETVVCFQLLEQVDEARRRIQEQLDNNPDSPKLLCLLGQLDNDPALWHKAWEASGQRYSRAMRNLGAYHFRNREYAESVECYGKALKLNSLFAESWYMMGCAAMQIENWGVGMEAFQRVVQLDYENGEAWNNLASIYLRMDDKKVEAWYALREALKSKFDSWQIWSNYLITSVALGKFLTAIYAMTRIIELRADKDGARCIDLDVLRIIINAITRDQQNDAAVDRSSEVAVETAEARTRRELKLAEALERLLTETIGERITAAPDIWRTSADYWFWKGDYKRCLDCYQKSYRHLATMPQVAYDPKVFEDAVEATLELVEMYENLGPKRQHVKKFPRLAGSSSIADKGSSDEDGGEVCHAWQRQAKMALRSLIGKTKASFEGTTPHNRLVNALEQLQSE